MLNTLYANLASPGGDRDALSAKTISYIHTIVHKALADAVDAELLQRNPAERAKPPWPNRQAAGGTQSWDPAELSTFLTAVSTTRLTAVWRLTAMTGMRRGEILGLRWADMDFDASRLAVRRADVAVGYDVVGSTPKSHNARVIDLDAETVSQLKAHREQHRVGSGLPGERPGRRQGERRANPSAPIQPVVRTDHRQRRPPQDPPTRPPPHPCKPRPEGRYPGQGDLGAPRPRIARVHAQAVRPRHPGHAGRGRRPDRRTNRRNRAGQLTLARSSAPSPT